MDEVLSIIITAVVVPILLWAFALLRTFVNAKIELIKDEKLRKALLAANEELDRAAKLATAEVSATFVEALKKSEAFDKEEAKQAMILAIAKTRQIMSTAGITVLEKSKVDVTTSIKAIVEKSLKECK